ncbi:MAG: efflux RND transporter permease subunit, partial [Bacteroidales bacterium]|nr:efflux RND transporter permease subunit [Bacteroidales bacterium]
MSIYQTSVNKPITVIMIFIAVIVLGVFSFTKLPIDQFPEMEPPYVSVMTTYSGANSSELETNISKILENTLNSVDGLKEITSTSKDNISIVTMEFEWGSNLDESVNDIRSAIDMVYDNLPDGCSRPLIFKFNTSMMPIMQYAITAKESYPGLEKILDDQVVNVLNRIDGIGNLSLSGAPERYIYIDLDPKKMDAYNLTLEAVGQAIQANNLNLASGNIKMGKEQYQMRVQGEYVESNEIENIIVANIPQGRETQIRNDATPIRSKVVFLRDIAAVKDTIKDLSLEEKIDGQDGVRLVIMKQSGANTVQVAKDVRKELAEIQKKLPSDIQIKMIYDSSENIQNSISGLEETIMYALLFVVLVVLFFLGKWRATIIIAITIPISLITAFIYLKLTNSSLNIISLSSLSIAIGMVVDDAIVVLENISTHISRGSSPREAAIYATNEVWVSVIASTLVIVAVFVPLTMLGGMAGIMFKELGWIVTIVVTVSTIVAITLTPMLSSQLLKSEFIYGGKQIAKKQRKYSYNNTVVKALDKLDELYARALRACLHHKTVTISVVVLIFAVSLIPALTGMIGTDFMPNQDNGRMDLTIELQRGTRVEESIKTARKIEEHIMRLVPETELISSSTGSSDASGISSLFTNASNNKISMTVRTSKKYERKRTIFEIAEIIRQDLELMPEVINYQVSTASGFGGGQTNSVNVEIYGYNFDKTNQLAADIKQKLKNVKGASDITISREEDRAELQIVFDKEKLALNGLGSVQVSMMVRNRVNGMLSGYLKEDGEEYDIVVRLEEKYRSSLSDIEEMTIMSPFGKQIKLRELAEVKEYWAPPQIDRKRRE